MARSAPGRADNLDAVTTSYRCGACGNRTRFDVVSTRRTRAFEHYGLDGTLSVEEEEVLGHEVESVTCRWCGSAKSIEAVDDASVAAGEDSPEHDAAQGGSR